MDEQVRQRVRRAARCAEHFQVLLECTTAEVPPAGLLAGPVRHNWEAARELHPDLIVRVWGFSARFIDLPDDMQDHIIERAVAGTM
jgi:hypothetical protein